MHQVWLFYAKLNIEALASQVYRIAIYLTACERCRRASKVRTIEVEYLD